MYLDSLTAGLVCLVDLRGITLSMSQCSFYTPRMNCVRVSRAARRMVRVEAVASPSFLGECPPAAMSTVQSIREAVAHSTCGPYFEIASESTTIVNPPWADEPRAKVRNSCMHAASDADSVCSVCVSTST